MMKEVYCQFLDEIGGAEEYIRCAAKYKEKNRDLSSMYRNMSENEISHAEKLIDAMRKLAEMEEKKRFSDDDSRDEYSRDQKKHYSIEASEMLVEFMEDQLLKAKSTVSAFE